MESKTYAAAGVDIEAAEAFVQRLKNVSARQSHKQMWPGAGGYASIMPVTEQIGVAMTTDGVGTKLLLASELNVLNTIGIDLVAMCVNDLICVGATPTAFLDYYASAKLIDIHADALIKGIVAGCDLANIPLVGGETAEMPGLYSDNHFDLAGFAIGLVPKEQLITGMKIRPGDSLVGVASSGIHSNGLSLARKILTSSAERQMLLTPTKIYVKPTLELFAEPVFEVTGIAHITGGGYRNLLRLNDQVGFSIANAMPVLEVFELIHSRGVAADEMFRTFNMGSGLVVITRQPKKVIEVFKRHGHYSQVLGSVSHQAGLIEVKAKLGGRSIEFEIK
jgi:phosphoribosylformylglycinamidine cyclo-ligase